MREAGDHTAIIGKWHLGLESPNLPNERGFDYFHGFLGDMMDSYTTHLRHGTNYLRRNREVIEPPGHATDLFTQWAASYLRQRAREPQPFFLYLACNAPLELYHLKTDPQETNNLAAVNSKLLRELQAALRAHIQRRGVVPWQPPAITR